MKVKTSITLDRELLEAVDKRYPNRSEFIEKLIRKELREQRKREREARDQAIIEKYADDLNAQALETLEYSAFYNEEAHETR